MSSILTSNGLPTRWHADPQDRIDAPPAPRAASSVRPETLQHLARKAAKRLRAQGYPGCDRLQRRFFRSALYSRVLMDGQVDDRRWYVMLRSDGVLRYSEHGVFCGRFTCQEYPLESLSPELHQQLISALHQIGRE